jgi:hypothetical protein
MILLEIVLSYLSRPSVREDVDEQVGRASPDMSPNNRMQRPGRDKVHAPNRHFWLKVSGYALEAQRAAADAGRWAALGRR